MTIGWDELMQLPWEYDGQGPLYMREHVVLVGPTRVRTEIAAEHQERIADMSRLLLEKPEGGQWSKAVNDWRQRYIEADLAQLAVERELTTERIWAWAHGDRT